jgi:hypothetical protein
MAQIEKIHWDRLCMPKGGAAQHEIKGENRTERSMWA